MAPSDGVQMGRYWEVETDHEGLVPVRACCGVSGRHERAARAGSAAIERREWRRREQVARAGGARGLREVVVCRWGGIGTQLGGFRPQPPLGRLGGWGVAPRP